MKKLNLYQLTWPIFVEVFLIMLLGSVDIIMLGRFSDHAAGAVSASNQLINFVNWLFVIISGGGSVLVAQNIGANRRDEVQKVVVVALFVNLVMGFIISFAMLFFSNSLLALMGVTEDLMPYATTYTKIVGGMIFFQAMLNTISTTIRNHGFTKITMKVTIGMNLINVLGNAVSIFGFMGIPVLGVTGVAFSTIFSKFVAIIVMTFFLFRNIIPLSSLKIIFKFPIHILKSILKIGLPSAGENISFNFSNIVVTWIIFTYIGQEAYITRAYVMNIAAFALIFSMAIGQSTQIMVGQLVGARAFDEAYKTCLRNFKIGMLFSTSTGILLIVFGKFFMGFFTIDPTLIALGAAVLIVDGILEPGRTFNLVIINGLRGAGDVVFPVVFGIISGWGFRIGVGYLFGVVLGYGLVGIFIAFLLDEWLRGICMLLRWKSKKWVQKVLV